MSALRARSEPLPFSLGAWTLATFKGWLLGFVLMLVVIAMSGVVGLGWAQFPVGLGMGLGVGWVQGRVRPVAAERRAWLSATAAGVALPFIVTDAAGALDLPIPYLLPVNVLVGGVLAGIFQSRVLGRVAGTAAWWIPASVVGWGLAVSAVHLTDRILPPGSATGVPGALLYIGVNVSGGVLLGVVEALAMSPIAARAPAPPPEAPAGAAAPTAEG